MQPGQNQLSPQRFEDSQNCTLRTSPKKQSGRKHNPVVFLKIDWHLQILWISGSKRPLKNSNAAAPEHICSLTTGMHVSLLWAVEFSSAVLQRQNASPTLFPLVWQVFPTPESLLTLIPHTAMGMFLAVYSLLPEAQFPCWSWHSKP